MVNLPKSNLCFKKLSMWFWRTQRFDDYCYSYNRERGSRIWPLQFQSGINAHILGDYPRRRKMFRCWIAKNKQKTTKNHQKENISTVHFLQPSILRRLRIYLISKQQPWWYSGEHIAAFQKINARTIQAQLCMALFDYIPCFTTSAVTVHSLWCLLQWYIFDTKWT